MFSGFRDFIFRGNVVDLAVAVIVGAAFNGVVAALVKDLLTPLIAAIFGKPNFAALTFTIHGSRFLYGDFINALVSFALVALAVYYFVVVPMNAVAARLRSDAVPLEERTCPECLSKIPLEAHRCAFCTSLLTA
jgi:large conductance mechanosensitive channel